MVESSASSLPSNARDRRKPEKLYSRFGWKWAVLAHTTARVLTQGGQLPSDFLHDLKCAKTMMESGCHSLYEVAAGVGDLEIKLFPGLLRATSRKNLQTPNEDLPKIHDMTYVNILC
jgi:hypothetical protein